jgi:hypothetical protein
MTDECAEDGVAQLLLEAYHNGTAAYVHVAELELGGPELEPLDVQVGAWQAYAFEGQFAITGIPDGLSGQLGIDTYQGRGLMQNRNFGIVPENGTDTVMANRFVPNAGTSAWQTIQLFPEDPVGELTIFSQTRRDVSFPYPAQSSLSYGDTLPIPELQVAGLTVSYSAIQDDGLDRIVIDLEFASEATWRVWTPPASSSFTLPNTPSALAEVSKEGIDAARISIEDLSDASGYASAFERWSYDETAHLNFVDWGPQFEYRTATQVWTR